MFPVILTIIGHISLGNGLPVLDKDQTATTTVSSNDSAPQDLWVVIILHSCRVILDQAIKNNIYVV